MKDLPECHTDCRRQDMKRTYKYGDSVPRDTRSIESVSNTPTAKTAFEAPVRTVNRTADRNADDSLEILSARYRNYAPFEQYRRNSRVRICRKSNMPMMNIAFL